MISVTPLWHDVFMLIEAAQRVREGLAELIRLTNAAGASTSDLRAVLVECKTFGGQLAVLQSDAAAVVAARERHGDSGTGVLAQAAGLSRRDAASQVKTAERLQSMPTVRDAVESGEISFANAKTLAQASDKTSTGQVAQDGMLLEKAAALPPDQFAREAGRWAAQRQNDDGEELYRRQRARRRLSIWDGDDGTVHLRGELDPVTGAKVRKRFLKEAERLRRDDARNPGGEERSFHQRMADALETLTSDSGTGTDPNGRDKCAGGCGRRPSAEVVIVQHLSADGTAAFAEVAGGGTIPQSVLEEHFCNAEITGVVFDHKGKPLWQGHTKRTATPAQMRALEALYGTCAGCGAPFVLCQAHHVEPVSQGGRTDMDNMIPLCWGCHHKVHHHDWRVVPSGDLRTIAPPERIRYGPARAPDPPPAPGLPPRRASKRTAPRPGAQPSVRSLPVEPKRTEALPQAEPLFALT